MYYSQLLILIPLVAGIPRECDKQAVHFYEVLGCNVTQTDSSLCPISYRCPQYEIGYDFCMAGGKHYDIGDTIQEIPDCYSCSCYGYYGGERQFSCSSPRCGRQEINVGCYYKSGIGGCCLGDEYCPNSNTTTCVVDGQTFLEHQMIYPKDTCWECVCMPGFILFQEPFCRRIQCGLELNYFEELEDNLTPFYQTRTYTDALCCPSGFISPDEVTSIRLDHIEPNPTGIECTFGNLHLPLLTRISVSFMNYGVNVTASCTCSTAPHVTCIIY